MLNRSSLAAILLLSLSVYAVEVPSVVEAQSDGLGKAAAENPYRLAKVGDWVEWKITTQSPSEKADLPPVRGESHIKELVRSVSIKLLSMQVQILGQSDPVFMETQYSLERSYHPEWLGQEGKVELLKEPVSEPLVIAGRSLDCVKKELKMTGENGSSNLTIWYSPEIPLGGIARMELRLANGVLTTREVKAFGREKK